MQAQAVARRVDRHPDRLIVSPFLRAAATAEPILKRWPATPVAIWAIEEFTYLSPALCDGSTVETRRPMVRDYWQRSDPDYIHGLGAESFGQFLQRVAAFHEGLLALKDGFTVVVGHGQFFRAFGFALSHGFAATPDGMRRYREGELANPMANGEILVFDGTRLSPGGMHDG
jgi:broad specificity phosphatase PhoE